MSPSNDVTAMRDKEVRLSTSSEVPTSKISKGIILLNNNPPSSGVGRYAYSLHRSLLRLNLNVNFIAWDKLIFDQFYKRLYALKLNTVYYLLKFRWLSSELGKKIPDRQLVHVTNAGYLASVVPRLKGKNRCVIITAHDSIPMHLRDGIGHKISGRSLTFARFADHIIAVSEYTKKMISARLELPERRVSVVYYGVDHDLFKPRNKFEVRKRLGFPTNRPIILNVGSEEPRKNVPTLLRSFNKLLSNIPNALLIRIGDTTLKTQKLIKDLGLNNRVISFRRASSDEIALYYNAADLLVHPAVYEDFGMPILEAMASGIPVVASNRTGIPEVVGNTGILLDPLDTDGFSYWMYRILTDDDLKIKLSDAGHNRSLNYGWEKCAKETLDVYIKAHYVTSS